MKINSLLRVDLSLLGPMEDISLNQSYIVSINDTSVNMGLDSSDSKADNLEISSRMDFISAIFANIENTVFLQKRM